MIAAIYARKSQDDSDKAEAQSTVRQIQRAREFAASRGWSVDDRFIWEDVGISGAEFERRPGLQALLGSLDPAPFGALIVSESSRLGRDTIRTLATIQRITDASVKIFSYLDGREISLNDEMDEVQAFIGSWASSAERRKAAARVKDTLLKRAQDGYVAGGKVFGYTNVCAACGTPTAPRRTCECNAPVRRVVNEHEAAVVQRIFEMAAEGLGFVRIAKTLTASLTISPRNGWTASGVREVLQRDLYRAVSVYGRRRHTKKQGTKIRRKVDPSEWLRREVPELRIVSEELWATARAKLAENSAQFLRQNGKIVGQRENHPGKYRYLLSGFLACGVCSGNLVASSRGRKNTRAYVCITHRFSGSCENGTAVPMDRLHATVIAALQDTFSADNFERFHRARAADEQARSKREAERQSIIAALPKLAADEQRIVRRIATVEDDSLVAALKEQWQGFKAERERAEARLAEIEGEERDLREQAEAIETFRQRWNDWRGALTAEPVLARQLLRKILVGPVLVIPKGRGAWEFIGGSRYDAVLHGGLSDKGDAIRAWSPEGRARMVAALRAEFPTAEPLGSSAWGEPVTAGTGGGDDGRSLPGRR